MAEKSGVPDWVKENSERRAGVKADRAKKRGAAVSEPVKKAAPAKVKKQIAKEK